MASETPTPSTAFTIGTRSSHLARVQTDLVKQALQAAHPAHEYKVHAILSTGDKDKVTPLPQMSEKMGDLAKSLWTGELEALLAGREIDLIVHSLKDMPTVLPPNLILASTPARADPRDALILSPRFPPNTTLASLPKGSCIGTSSLRRTAQLRRLYPHLTFADVRGNIGTRLAKLDAPDSRYAAIILAAAGLDRIGMQNRITSFLTREDGGMLHAVGQGALGIEVREDDVATRKLLEPVTCQKTFRAISAERSLMRTLEGGCSVPIGVQTSWVKRKAGVATGVQPPEEAGSEDRPAGQQQQPDLTDELEMYAIVVSVDGTQAAEAHMTGHVKTVEDAEKFGVQLAQMLVERGAKAILDTINIERERLKAIGVPGIKATGGD